MNNSKQQNGLILFEIEGYTLNEVIQVYLYLHEYIKHVFNSQLLDRHKAAVTIMDYEVTFQGFWGQVVNATGSIGNITKDQALYVAEGIDDVRD